MNLRSLLLVWPALLSIACGAGGPADLPARSDADARLEAAILAAQPDYDPAFLDGAGARYVHASVDLDGDGQDEHFVYLLGPWFCGSGGCTLLLFDSALRLSGDFPIARLPVVVGASVDGGYGPIFKPESGGGASPSWVEYRYRGGEWIEVQRLPGKPAPEGLRVLTGEVDYATAPPLQVPE